MTRGRKPIPSALNDLRGNPGKRKHDSEPKPPPSALLCPKWLRGEAKTAWKRWSKQLAACGVLTELDEDALALACEAWREFHEYRVNIKVSGAVLVSLRQDSEGNDVSGGLYQSPYVSLARAAWEKLLKLMAEFGMTPSSGARLKVAPLDEPTLDPLEVLLNGAGIDN